MKVLSKYLICLMLFMCMILSGCVKEDLNALPGTDQWEAHTEQEETELSSHQDLTTNVLAQTGLGVGVGEKISLPTIPLRDLIVIAKEDSVSSGKAEENRFVYLLGDYRYDGDTLHDGYIALEQKDKILLYDLGNRSLEDKIYLCDLNADGIDEIVLHQVVDVFGGGRYISRVFMVEHNGITEMFRAEPDSTGYSCEALDGYQFKVSNTFTDYSRVINISSLYPKDAFSKTGKLIEKIEISYGSFLEFAPKDIDGDGIFEIECLQMLYFDWHRNFVGYARSVIRYNNETQKFDVIRAEYLESAD